MVSSCL